MQNSYGYLLNLVSISQQDYDTLIDLLAEREAVNDDIRIAKRRRNELYIDNKSEQALVEITNHYDAEIETDIRVLLGPERYQIFYQYRSELPYRQALSEISRRLSYSNFPITVKQTEDLVSELKSAELVSDQDALDLAMLHSEGILTFDQRMLIGKYLTEVIQLNDLKERSSR